MRPPSSASLGFNHCSQFDMLSLGYTSVNLERERTRAHRIGEPKSSETELDHHQQCDVNYREIRRTTVWSYEFHRRIDGRVPSAEGTRPYEKLPIPTDLAIVHITLLVAVSLPHSFACWTQPSGRTAYT